MHDVNATTGSDDQRKRWSGKRRAFVAAGAILVAGGIALAAPIVPTDSIAECTENAWATPAAFIVVKVECLQRHASYDRCLEQCLQNPREHMINLLPCEDGCRLQTGLLQTGE